MLLHLTFILFVLSFLRELIIMHVGFRLEIAFTGKTVGIMVKSSKTLQEALSAVLQKHNLKLQEAQVTMVSLYVRMRP